MVVNRVVALNVDLANAPGLVAFNPTRRLIVTTRAASRDNFLFLDVLVVAGTDYGIGRHGAILQIQTAWSGATTSEAPRRQGKRKRTLCSG